MGQRQIFDAALESGDKFILGSLWEGKLVGGLVGVVVTSTRVSLESLAPTRSPVDADWSSASDELKTPNLLKEIIDFFLF